jgi:hypothetical protein
MPNDPIVDPNNSPGYIMNNDHIATLQGYKVGISNWYRYSNYYYDVAADKVVEFATSDQIKGFSGDHHLAGQWVFDNGAGLGQWYAIDSCRQPEDSYCKPTSNEPNVAIRRGMIGLVRLNPPDVRLVAAHDSRVDAYDEFPKSTLSPDGKFIMWTSDMNNSGRTDVFIAKMPVTGSVPDTTPPSAPKSFRIR